MRGRILKIAGGKYIETAGSILDHAKTGSIVHNSAKDINISAGRDIVFGEYEAPEPPKKKQEDDNFTISEIEILDLDEGSTNGGANDALGMIYGKEYTLKVTKYKDDKAPKRKSVIKWACTYTTEEGIANLVAIKETGEEITFKMGDLELCGKSVTFYAYIESKEDEASLEVFHHYRFRWFDRETVLQQLRNRESSPWLIDQGGSSLCGVAIVGYYLARDNFNVYEDFIKDMHAKGEATFSNTNYKVEIDSDEHLLEYKTTDNEYPQQSNYPYSPIEEIDFIFMLTIKDYLNDVWDYDPDNENSGGISEGSTGLTLPYEIEQMFKNINGYTDIENSTNLLVSKWSSVSSSVLKLKQLLAKGYNIALLIEAGGFQSNEKETFSKPTHWVGLKSIINDTKNKKITVTVYTWARVAKQWIISHDVFKDSYYGYVSGK